MEGPTANEGRVEVCINRRWGTVCGYYDLGGYSLWGPLEALVVCRQLEYNCKFHDCLSFQCPIMYPTDGIPLPIYGGGSAVQIHYIYCDGDEAQLQNRHSGSAACDHSTDAGVICSTG